MGEKKIDEARTIGGPADIPLSAPARLRKFLTYSEFQRDVADWSKETILRRIRNEGFPVVKDGAGYLIPTDEMLEWFKKRKVDSRNA